MRKHSFRTTGIIALVLSLALMLTLTACGERKVIRSITEFDIPYDTSRYIYFEIELESGDVIGGQLEPLIAPVTVRNFVTLAEDGYYNGKTFNFIISDDIVMCSTPESDPPYTIYGEFANNGWRNTIGHQRGVISMGRSDDDYNSAYGSFFILLKTRSYYNGDYASFGEITSGLGILDKLSHIETDENRTPTDPPVIKEIRILGN